MRTLAWTSASLVWALSVLPACGDDLTTADDEVGETGDGDGDTTGDGDGDTTGDGDGDGDTTGDGDGDTTGDGDGDTTGDGDGDTTGDGDGDGDTTGDGDGDGDGMQSCELETQDLTLLLVGSQSPEDGCSDHTFTGTLTGGAGGQWFMDACPCGAQCLVPDPYTLTISVPDDAMLPTVPACPKVEFRRDPDTCEPIGMVIRDLDDAERPVWTAGEVPLGPPTVAELAVDPVDGTDCVDYTQYALQFGWDQETLVLPQGEQGVLPADSGDWTVRNYASTVSGDLFDYDWVLKR